MTAPRTEGQEDQPFSAPKETLRDLWNIRKALDLKSDAEAVHYALRLYEDVSNGTIELQRK